MKPQALDTEVRQGGTTRTSAVATRGGVLVPQEIERLRPEQDRLPTRIRLHHGIEDLVDLDPRPALERDHDREAGVGLRAFPGTTGCSSRSTTSASANRPSRASTSARRGPSPAAGARLCSMARRPRFVEHGEGLRQLRPPHEDLRQDHGALGLRRGIGHRQPGLALRLPQLAQLRAPPGRGARPREPARRGESRMASLYAAAASAYRPRRASVAARSRWASKQSGFSFEQPSEGRQGFLVLPLNGEGGRGLQLFMHVDPVSRVRQLLAVAGRGDSTRDSRAPSAARPGRDPPGSELRGPRGRRSSSFFMDRATLASASTMSSVSRGSRTIS